MDDISLYISKDTVEKKKYLIDFFERIDKLKKDNTNINVYRLGIEDHPKFWQELYEDYKLPEEKCLRKYIRIGENYQADLSK